MLPIRSNRYIRLPFRSMKRGLAAFLSLLFAGLPSSSLFAQDSVDASLVIQSRVVDLFARHNTAIVRVKATRQTRDDKKIKRSLKMGLAFLLVTKVMFLPRLSSETPIVYGSSSTAISFFPTSLERTLSAMLLFSRSRISPRSFLLLFLVNPGTYLPSDLLL